MEPPAELDGAKVLCWAYSEEPYFVMPSGDAAIPIHGLAVCQYGSGQIYRFSCDVRWEVQTDMDHETVEEAMGAASPQFSVECVRWVPRTEGGKR